MSELADVVRRRRMTREFSPRPLPPGALEQLVDLASRAPSAGKSQGWHLLVLEGAGTRRFWDVTLPVERRARFRWPALLDAPVVALVLADPQAYLDRYAEEDKAHTGLVSGESAWPAPYWTIDASMAVMTLLLAADELGLGALLFGVFHDEEELRRSLGVPDRVELVGAIALGFPADGPVDAGRSATRRRRDPSEIIHRGTW